MPMQVVAPEMVLMSCFTRQFCAALIRTAEACGGFDQHPDDPVPGHELSLAQISPRLFDSLQNDLGSRIWPQLQEQWQQIDYGSRYSESYVDALPDFIKLAESYGHVGLQIHKPADVEPALREAFGKYKDRLVFLDFITDQTENVWPMVKAGKGLTEMLLGSEDL